MSEKTVSPFDDRNSRVTKAEVGRIVHAARLLIEAHEKRSPTAEHTTLNEDTALFELNFQLGVYRTKNRMSR